MSSWIAICYGALDVRSHDLAGGKFDVVVTPTIPGEPLMLHGEGAALWRRLVDGPVEDSALTGSEQEILEEMERMGIAARDLNHPARLRTLPRPWLTSPLHELVYALLASVASETNTRLLFIKGPVLHAQGLRSREHSGDVDCWVEPGAELRFASAMKAWGWAPAVSAFTGTRVLHSLTMRASDWGCAVDVHSWFPGFTRTPADSFEQVLAATELREFGGVMVRTPQRAVHAVIAALNEVRPLRGAEAGAAKVRTAAAVLSTAGEDVVALAEELGAEYALAAPMRLAFPHRALDHYSDQAAPADWSWRLQTSPLRVYWSALKIVPLRERPRILFRVIWPTAESLRAGPLALDGDTTGIGALRVRRVRRALHQIREKAIR